MTAQRRGEPADGKAGRLSGMAFGAVGAAIAIAGVVSVVTGVPAAAHSLAPATGLGDLATRFGEFSLLISAGIAALVAASIVALLGARRLQPGQAGGELIVLGVAIVVCVLSASSRAGYAANGSVLPAAVASLAGGAAVIAAGAVAIFTSLVASPDRDL